MRTAVYRFISLFLLFVLPVAAVDAEYLRGREAMVSSRSDIASEIGSEILTQGGNAIDAAVATGFALSVAYPSAGNLGGGGFMVLHLAAGEVITLDFREKAPAAASRDMYLDSQGNVDRNLARSSRQASGVPGTVAGLLDVLNRYGTMTREQVIAPAIRLAEEGFILNNDIAGQFRSHFTTFRQYPASLAKFSKNGSPYAAGDRWVQPDLAATLRDISDQGRDGFYKGRVADLIVSDMAQNNGLITHADLQNYETVWREPVHGTYRGYDIWSMGPPSSGGTTIIQMLNMMEPFDVSAMGWGSTEAVHLLVEAQRRAYADRAVYMGDPDYSDIPVAVMTDKNYARHRFETFDPQRAGDSTQVEAGELPAESRNTTHYSVMDSEGNAVSATITLNSSYGNKIVVPGAGFLLNNEMSDFATRVEDSHVNQIQPGKRMMSSMSPTIVSKEGAPVLITGSPGGTAIINTVLQVILNVIDHGMPIDEAVTSPRLTHQWRPDIIRYESGAISEEVAKALEAMGHKGLNGSSFYIGEANSILVGEDYVDGMSDPRIVGGVAGY